jgi:hypothetical protein
MGTEPNFSENEEKSLKIIRRQTMLKRCKTKTNTNVYKKENLKIYSPDSFIFGATPSLACGADRKWIMVKLSKSRL